MPTQLQQHLHESCAFICSKTTATPRLGITLGSGLSSFADKIENPIKIPYAEIPHFHSPTVSGHGGLLIIGEVSGLSVAVLQGRVHYYEGHDMDAVVYPTRTLAMLGVKELLLTNACGGLDRTMRPGDFMIIKDHINLTGQNPLRGPNEESLGPRFPDMSEPYSKHLSQLLQRALLSAQARFSEGVYCGVIGPCYETAAEIRYLQVIGGQAVGMSTVAETIAARHMGVAVGGLSCITNLGTGLSADKLSHEEVTAVGKQVEAKFTASLKTFCELLKQ